MNFITKTGFKDDISNTCEIVGTSRLRHCTKRREKSSKHTLNLSLVWPSIRSQCRAPNICIRHTCAIPWGLSAGSGPKVEVDARGETGHEHLTDCVWGGAPSQPSCWQSNLAEQECAELFRTQCILDRRQKRRRCKHDACTARQAPVPVGKGCM